MYFLVIFIIRTVEKLIANHFTLQQFTHLRLLYTGKISLNRSNLFRLFLAIDKYDLTKLSDWVGESFIENLSIDNVMDVHDFFDQFYKPQLMDKIRLFIQNHTFLILEHSSFTRIQRKTLRMVLSQSKLNAAEIQLLQACLKWAKAECEQNYIVNPNPNQLREALGDEFFLIRFAKIESRKRAPHWRLFETFSKQEQTEFFDSNSTFFASRFENDYRKAGQMFPLYLADKFEYVPGYFNVDDLRIMLNLKSSADFLLSGFSFGPVQVSFSVNTLQLTCHNWSFYADDSIAFPRQVEKEVKEEGKIDFRNHYSIEFPSPQLISAGLTYDLVLILDLDQLRSSSREIIPKKFKMEYKRKFQEIPILIEFKNEFLNDFAISELFIY